MKILPFLILFTFYLFNINAQTKEDGIYQVVEEMPRFPGCENESKDKRMDCVNKKFLTFIYENLIYPEEAKRNETEGTVIVQFVIKKDGSIDNYKIVKDIGDGCAKEAIRALKEMPIWIPGKQRRKPVNVRYTLPVKFKLP